MPLTFLSWEMTIEIGKGHTYLETVDDKVGLGPKFTINKKIYNFSPIFMKLFHYCLRTHEVVIFAKFHRIMTINEDFLLMVLFKPSRKFSSTVSSS